MQAVIYTKYGPLCYIRKQIRGYRKGSVENQRDQTRFHEFRDISEGQGFWRKVNVSGHFLT